MRTAVIIALLALASTCAAESMSFFEDALPSGGAAPCERAVLDSFPTPGMSPTGIEWVGESGLLYHVDEDDGEVFSITPDGTATLLFDIGTSLGDPAINSVGNGIVRVLGDGRGYEHLYITDYNGCQGGPPYIDKLYRLDLSGTLVDSFWIETFCDKVVGICFDGSNFWLSCCTRSEIVKCDTLFREIEAFPHPGAGCGPIDYDPDNGLFYTMEYHSGTIYICDNEMGVLDSFAGPRGYALGLSVGRILRGRTLWSTSYDTGLIYEIDDPHPTLVAEDEWRWGTIKALFR